ncbi:MAG: ATP-binding protein [Raineya sp.]|nr:ATP-binding protein [Raineya sp.]
MKNPFVFGKVVAGENFVNRHEEITLLQNHFNHQIHTILISPRRWGKTSLVLQACQTMPNTKQFRFCYLDLFGVRSEQEFYQKFASEIIRKTATKWQEIGSWLKNFFRHLKPKISIGNQENEWSLDFEVSDNQHIEEVLNLPEKIAQKKNLKMVVCLDEFQNIDSFTETTSFQKLLRSYWQHHQKVSYCFLGSKRSMMSQIFEKQKMPFFKFGQVLHLNRIATEHWIEFLQKSFQATQKTISPTQALQIAEIAQNHPYYVQQIAFWVWLETDKIVQNDALEKAIKHVIAQNEPFYEQIVENLSHSQIQLLKAIVQQEKQLSSQETIKKYHLGTSALIVKNQRILQEKEIIFSEKKQYRFEDPLLEKWFSWKFVL